MALCTRSTRPFTGNAEDESLSITADDVGPRTRSCASSHEVPQPLVVHGWLLRRGNSHSAGELVEVSGETVGLTEVSRVAEGARVEPNPQVLPGEDELELVRDGFIVTTLFIFIRRKTVDCSGQLVVFARKEIRKG